MKRRSFLATAAVGLTTGCVGRVERQARSLAGDEAPASNTQDYPFSGEFKRVQFINLGNVLNVYAESDHQMQSFALAHSDQTDPEDWLGKWEAPDFEGPVSIPFLGAVQNGPAPYPNREFSLIAYEGGAGMVTIVTDTYDTVPVVLPRQYGDPALFGE